MNLISAIKSAFAPPDPPSLLSLASGLCALPAPLVVARAPKQKEAHDAFLEREETNTWGFHSATAQRQNEGSAPELTGYDIRLLKERGYWGFKTVQAKNAKAKAMWHNGKTEKECAASIGVGESWVEKRYGTFSTALSEEKAAEA